MKNTHRSVVYAHHDSFRSSPRSSAAGRAFFDTADISAALVSDLRLHQEVSTVEPVRRNFSKRIYRVADLPIGARQNRWQASIGARQLLSWRGVYQLEARGPFRFVFNARVWQTRRRVYLHLLKVAPLLKTWPLKPSILFLVEMPGRQRVLCEF